ncbi:MAG: DUF6470 family protein [Oscillospiraceae bacterium]|nr:DUF6470 family protein [Oscillospiraceae bacterium]
MAIQRLNIDQQFAEIGVRTTPAKLNIKMPRGQLTIKTEAPQMKIERKAASFKINRQKQNNESGLKGPLELAKTFRNKGRQKALQGVGQNKDDGNFLANTAIKGDKIPKLAAGKAKARLGPREFNIGLMPQSSPEIQWDKGYMRINWSKHSVVIDYSGEYMPDLTVDPKYSVEVFLRTEPYFRVMVEEAVESTGKYVDSAI